MAYAEVSDLEARMGRDLNAAEQSLAQVLLDDVEIIIRANIPDLDTRISSGELSVDVLIYVECAAVKRVILNAEGFLQETDGNYSYTRDTAVASGLLDLTSREWALLNGGQNAMFTIQPEWWDTAYPPHAPFGSANGQWFGDPSWQWLTRPL